MVCFIIVLRKQYYKRKWIMWLLRLKEKLILQKVVYFKIYDV